MGQKLETFLGGSPPSLRWASLGFLIIAAGAVLAFSIDYGPRNPLAYLALGIGAVGVGITWVAVLGGLSSTLRRSANDDSTNRGKTPRPPRE